MAKRSFDDETLKWVREMPLSLVLDRLRDAGKLFWRRDTDFKPEKDARTVRLYVSSPEGAAWELLVTGPKWFDTRAGKGGGARSRPMGGRPVLGEEGVQLLDCGFGHVV